MNENSHWKQPSNRRILYYSKDSIINTTKKNSRSKTTSTKSIRTGDTAWSTSRVHCSHQRLTLNYIFLRTKVFNKKESDGLYCNTCQVNVNSKAQLKQHMNSTKHKMIEMGLIRKETPNCTRVVRNLELSCFFPKKIFFAWVKLSFFI